MHDVVGLHEPVGARVRSDRLVEMADRDVAEFDDRVGADDTDRPRESRGVDRRSMLGRCPTEAIQINASTGAKEISDGLCVGCKVCTIACPFGTVNYNESSGKVIKCDLCGGDPACATACPTQAITYVDAQWTGYDKMRAWAERTDNQATAQA